MSTKAKRTQCKTPKGRRSNARLADLLAEKRDCRCPPEIFDSMVENHQDVLPPRL
ncbi:hypothetical protein ACFL3F_00515 [Planctomycetota bacterium]